MIEDFTETKTGQLTYSPFIVREHYQSAVASTFLIVSQLGAQSTDLARGSPCTSYSTFTVTLSPAPGAADAEATTDVTTPGCHPPLDDEYTFTSSPLAKGKRAWPSGWDSPCPPGGLAEARAPLGKLAPA